MCILGKVEGERWETNIKRAIFYINKVQKRAIFWAKARYFEGEFSHAPAFFPSMGHILGKVEGERWETDIKRAIFYINKVQKRAILRENSPMLPHFFQVWDTYLEKLRESAGRLI